MNNATAAAIGVTYRRLDYWARMGWLRPDGGRGSGCWRKWSDDELAVAALMARLIDGGLALRAAAPIARRAVEGGTPTHYEHLGDGLYLSIVVDVTS
jgi:DNA-binding transcriptional MerR regulator